jgi:hypothetical protein
LGVAERRIVFISVAPGSVVVTFFITSSAESPAGTLLHNLQQLVADDAVVLVGAKVLNVVALPPSVAQATQNKTAADDSERSVSGWMEDMIFEDGRFSSCIK